MGVALAIIVAMIGIAAILFSIMIAIAIKLVLLGFFCWVIYRAFFRKPKVEYVAVSIDKKTRNFVSGGINTLDLPMILIVMLLCFLHVWRNDKDIDSKVNEVDHLAKIDGSLSGFQSGISKIKKQFLEIADSPDKPENQKPIKVDSNTEKLRIQSEPCATQEKAKFELSLKIREFIENELNIKTELSDQAIDDLIYRLKLPVEIDTDYKEIAGEKFPVYVAKMEIENDKVFRKKITRIAHAGVAQNRFGILLRGSALAVVGLAVVRVGLGRNRLKQSVN